MYAHALDNKSLYEDVKKYEQYLASQNRVNELPSTLIVLPYAFLLWIEMYIVSSEIIVCIYLYCKFFMTGEKCKIIIVISEESSYR